MIVKLLNKILNKLKGSGYSIDPNIPSAYLINLVFNRFLMLIRGLFSFVPHKGFLFIGRNVIIKCKGKMSLGKSCTIDNGCFIDALSSNGIRFGNNVSMGKRSVIECTGSLKNLGVGFLVGDGVGLGRDCFYGCAGGIEIGSDTIIGNFVSFHSENHVFSDVNIAIKEQGVTHKGIIIGKGCWIGAKATILDGANIGSGCIIAAGAVVASGVYKDNEIYGGIPAKFLKKRI